MRAACAVFAYFAACASISKSVEAYRVSLSDIAEAKDTQLMHSDIAESDVQDGAVPRDDGPKPPGYEGHDNRIGDGAVPRDEEPKPPGFEGHDNRIGEAVRYVVNPAQGPLRTQKEDGMDFLDNRVVPGISEDPEGFDPDDNRLSNVVLGIHQPTPKKKKGRGFDPSDNRIVPGASEEDGLGVSSFISKSETTLSLEEDGLKASSLEARFDAGEGSGTGKSLFEQFFEDPSNFRLPGEVEAALACGMFCSGKKVGEWRLQFASDTAKSFIPAPAYGIGAEKPCARDGCPSLRQNLVVQWEGHKTQDAKHYAPIFGGWAQKQLHVAGPALDTNSPRGFYRIARGLGMGDNSFKVYNKMCPGGKDDGKTRKYAFPMHWDTAWEMENLQGSGYAQNKESLNKMKPYEQGLLVVKYKCISTFMPMEDSPGDFLFLRVNAYFRLPDTVKGEIISK